jgi:hypothetical protein
MVGTVDQLTEATHRSRQPPGPGHGGQEAIGIVFTHRWRHN